MRATASSCPPARAAGLPAPVQQVAAWLRAEIDFGVFPAGSTLPPVGTLARSFEVARATMLRALGELAGTGYAERRGEVRWGVPPVMLEPSLLAEHPADVVRGAVTELRAWQALPAGAWGATLALAPGALVEVLDTRVGHLGRSVSLSRTLLPSGPFPHGVAGSLRRHGSFAAAWRALGIGAWRARALQRIQRLPSDAESRELGRPAGAPVHVLDFVVEDTAGRPLCAGFNVYAGDVVAGR